MSNPIAVRRNIPACPAGVCLRILSEYIGRKPSLKSFYDEDSLVECALRAEAMINELMMSGCDLQTAKELSIFVLFDLVVFIEDNQSMLNAENDGALKALRNRLWEIARIYDVANPGIGIKSVRFLNQENGRRNVTSRTMDGLLGDYRFRANADRVAIGAMLDKRILERFIYNPPFRLKKPVIIMIIIHSEVEDESQHSLEEAINDCVLRCKASNSLGEGAATFHISRVGHDKGAERYLTRLMARKVQNLYCFPPLADLPPESPGEIHVISETTRILFRDALDLHLDKLSEVEMDIPIDEKAGLRDEIDPYSDLSDWASADEDILPTSPPTWPKKHLPPPPRIAVWHTSVNLSFRVRGIPHGATLTDISDALSSVLKFEPTGITIDPYESTIVPDCYSAKTQVALIQFTPAVPPALTILQTNETFTARLATGEEITVDKDFFGYTQLYAPNGEIAADIVAVCGLNGHPYGSWAAKPDFYGNKRMWLRHFLPKHFPQCRTMIYGYNSNLKHQSRHGIHDYVDTFLEEMEKIRNTEKEKARPVILIGHSFGGIVIAHSIAEAYTKHSSSVITNIRGIIFFGTPHRGLLVDDLLTMVGDASPRVEMIQDLSPGSEVLQKTLETFISICEQRKWKIVSFRERGQTRKLVKGKDGVWARKGEYYTAVESESLVLNLPSTIEKTLPAEGDHSTMVKFEHEYHSTYTSLLRTLHELILKRASTHRRRREVASSSVFESEGKRARRQRRQSSV